MYGGPRNTGARTRGGRACSVEGTFQGRKRRLEGRSYALRVERRPVEDGPGSVRQDKGHSYTRLLTPGIPLTHPGSLSVFKDVQRKAEESGGL